MREIEYLLDRVVKVVDRLEKVEQRVATISGIQPLIIRSKHAPAYMGMNRNRFNSDIRPYVNVITIGKRGVGFDRAELDAFAKARGWVSSAEYLAEKHKQVEPSRVDHSHLISDRAKAKKEYDELLNGHRKPARKRK